MTAQAWRRNPWWDIPEDLPWEDDGCDHLRRAAVCSIPDIHPRVRRAYELLLRDLRPRYWRGSANAVERAAQAIRSMHEARLQGLRSERLEAEAEFHVEALRARGGMARWRGAEHVNLRRPW